MIWQRRRGKRSCSCSTSAWPKPSTYSCRQSRPIGTSRVRTLWDSTICSTAIAEAASEYVDLIAERGVALGGVAEGTVQVVSRRSKLPEYSLIIGEWTAHVEGMRTALATFAKAVRQAIDDATELKDADTADLFTEVSRGADKLLWMVEAHVQK